MKLRPFAATILEDLLDLHHGDVSLKAIEMGNEGFDLPVIQYLNDKGYITIVKDKIRLSDKGREFYDKLVEYVSGELNI